MDNADASVWDGMCFRDVACQMSHLQEPYDMHLRRMSCDREWVDASVIHALACAFHVDVAIWQARADPMLVGHSLLSRDPASALVPVALTNDHHFWGVVVMEADKRAPVDKLTAADDWVALPRPCPEASRDSDDDDRTTTIPMALDMTPAAMNPEEVDAELHLCDCLATWSPWDVPTQQVISSL